MQAVLSLDDGVPGFIIIDLIDILFVVFACLVHFGLNSFFSQMTNIGIPSRNFS